MIKFFVFLLLSLSYFAEAAQNRSTVWLLANSQIYSTNAGYAACTSTGTATPTSNTFLTTSNLKIVGDVVGVTDSRGASSPFANTPITATTGQAVVESLTITFYYNTTYFLTLTLPTARTALAVNTAPTASTTNTNLIPLYSYNSAYTLASSISTLPVVADTNNVYLPNGNLWLRFTSIPGILSSVTTALSPTNVWSYGFVVNDYFSSSSISVVQWVDDLNSIYQFGANVLTSSITGSSVLSLGCTTISVGKRSVDHFRLKRATPSSTCPSSSNEVTVTSPSTTLTSLCSKVQALIQTGTCGGTGGAAGTATTTACLTDALAKGVAALDALSTQSVVFSTSGPRLISGEAHYLLLISSMLFLLF